MSKAAQRRTLTSIREALGTEHRAAASDRACDHLMTSSFWPPRGPVALFSAIQPEADTAKLEAALVALGITVVYPKVVGSRISFRRALRHEMHPAPPFQILEPADDSEEVRPVLVIVPGLGFTRVGGRLGYGGGYYDRTLAALRADPSQEAPLTTVGFCFVEQIVETLPIDPWDQSLDAVVSDEGLVVCVDSCRKTAPPGTSAP